MAKIEYQVIPSELYESYKKNLLFFFNIGFNFYKDGYYYIPIPVVRKKRRWKDPYSDRGIHKTENLVSIFSMRPLSIKQKITLFGKILDPRFLRWTIRQTARSWNREPKSTPNQFPYIAKYGKSFWKYQISPNPKSCFWTYYLFSKQFYVNMRRPPWDTSDDLYITNTTSNMILQYSINTLLLRNQIGGFGTSPSKFDHPTGICEYDGVLYVSDTYNRRIQLFNSITLEYITSITGHGPNNDPFQDPRAIRVDAEYIFIIDWITNYLIRIYRKDFSKSNTKYLYDYNYGNILSADSIAIWWDSIYICSTVQSRIIKIDKQVLDRAQYHIASEFENQGLNKPFSIDVFFNELSITDLELQKITYFLLSKPYTFSTMDISYPAHAIANIGYFTIILNGDLGKLTVINNNDGSIWKEIVDSSLVGSKYMCTKNQQFYKQDF